LELRCTDGALAVREGLSADRDGRPGYHYFIVYQLSVIRRAIDELFVQLREKVEEVREVERLIRADSFNHRQLALLGDAIRTPGHA
jgi:hypothetical protein